MQGFDLPRLAFAQLGKLLAVSMAALNWLFLDLGDGHPPAPILWNGRATLPSRPCAAGAARQHRLTRSRLARCGEPAVFDPMSSVWAALGAVSQPVSPDPEGRFAARQARPVETDGPKVFLRPGRLPPAHLL